MSDQDPTRRDPYDESSGAAHTGEEGPRGASDATPAGAPPPPPPSEERIRDLDEGPSGTAGYAHGQATGGPWIRLGARILDGIIVGIPLSLLFWLIPGVDVGGVTYNIVSALIGFGYFVYLESNEGATYGKKILNLRVATQGGVSPITTDASVRRNWWMLLGVLAGIPVISFLASLASLGIAIAIGVTIGSDDRDRGFHDQMAGTIVPRTA